MSGECPNASGDWRHCSGSKLVHPIQILQKATKGTKGLGGNHGSLFPWLPFVKIPGFERLADSGGQDARRETSSSALVVFAFIRAISRVKRIEFERGGIEPQITPMAQISI
jgi:hypothetical protein